MAYEISSEDMTQEARFVCVECAMYDPDLNAMGEDPLDMILELEQLALNAGFSNVHDYIEYELNQIN